MSDDLVDVLFQRLAAMYGNLWVDRYAGLPVAAVKAEWARVLGRYETRDIRLGLDALVAAGGAFPPSLPEFVALVRQASRRGAHRIALVPPFERAGPPGGFKALKEVLRAAKTGSGTE